MLNDYATEKVREIELELAAKRMQHTLPAKRSAPVFGPVLRAAGRTLRRAGEGLESWAAPQQRPTHPPEWHRFNFE